jgi:hypothetical protein
MSNPMPFACERLFLIAAQSTDRRSCCDWYFLASVIAILRKNAGANMRLNAGGVRELHWHKAAGRVYRIAATALTPRDQQILIRQSGLCAAIASKCSAMT